jgi:flagellar biosynthesis protein FlhF
MNVKRFTGRTSRDAMTLVRQAFGDDAVIVSTKPCAEGVEILAMAPETVAALERVGASAPAQQAPQKAAARPAAAKAAAAKTTAARTAAAPGVDEDVEKLAMSTLSFQDYVRERMLKRRQAALESQAAAEQAALPPVPATPAAIEQRLAQRQVAQQQQHQQQIQAAAPVQGYGAAAVALEPELGDITIGATRVPAARRGEPPVLREAVNYRDHPSTHMSLADSGAAAHQQQNQQQHHQQQAAAAAAARAAAEQLEMMNELRSMKGLIEDRFGALAFMEKLQRSPGQARLTQKLLDCGFSPALIRKLAAGMPGEVANEQEWAASVLERNLFTGDAEAALEDQGGVYAMIGSTGVGKTTSTAKLAAAFAAKHGAANLGLVTLDAYRLGAHEQLRAYGRILGVPVHTAHDRTALEDLLDLLSAKKMVLIDTAGLAQRDTRTRELLDMLAHRSINKLLVINAAAQGETIEDVMVSYRAPTCRGIVLSKLDEAVKLGPALDALIRHKLKVVGVANGQRVPEDWHRLSSHALVHRALRAGGSPAYKLDANDVNLVFAAPQGAAAARAQRAL